MLQNERLDVPREMVNWHERNSEGECERFAKSDADQKRANETRTLCDGNGVQIFEPELRVGQSLGDDTTNVPNVLARGELRDDTAPLTMNGHL
jgi:hypothetical protein